MIDVLIGLDDLYHEASPGTGQFACRLAAALEWRGAKVAGITRHQFILDHSLHYATHNCGACLEIKCAPEFNFHFAVDLVSEWSCDGSNPGLCIVPALEVPQQVIKWGYAAQQKVLKIAAAVDLAASNGVFLRALSGNGQGIIGAMASVGLRASRMGHCPLRVHTSEFR